MQKSAGFKIVAVVAMLSAAAYITWTWWKDQRPHSAQAFFYDLSEKRLFAASQDAVPPIAGLDGKELDAVRAVVFSPTGDCKRDRQIAYLEKYSPELKAQFEVTKKDPAADFPRLSRSAAQSHTFVRRISDSTWHPMDSEEAARIVGEWRLTGAGGADPIICIP
jgi:hypothetical protein